MSLSDRMSTLKEVADLLQVSLGADKDMLNAAKKVLSAKYHPDRNNGDDSKIKDINEAYSILSTKENRASFERHAKKGTVIGSYRILEKIAEGGFGATYKAEHLITKQTACLKQGFLAGAESEAILLDEARALWDMRHYALPAMRDVIRHEGSIILVMSYIEGPTLEEVVDKAGRLDPENTAWITQRLLNGLLYLHQNGVVHGDLKPKNIIVQPSKHLAVLVDFGLAAIRPTGKTTSKGYTELFSAPEMVDGKPPLPETDLYSLGKTMLYCLTGSYDGVEKLNVPASTPDAMCSFLKRLIVRDPLHRPNWTKENLIESFAQMRVDSFGRVQSNLKSIPGFA